MMKNYVIRNSDGDTFIDELTDEELEDRLGEQYYGESVGMPRLPRGPRANNTNYWDESILIIRGEIITGRKNGTDSN